MASCHMLKGCRFYFTNAKDVACLTKLYSAFLSPANCFCLFNKFCGSRLAVGFSFNL